MLHTLSLSLVAVRVRMQHSSLVGYIDINLPVNIPRLIWMGYTLHAIDFMRDAGSAFATQVLFLLSNLNSLRNGLNVWVVIPAMVSPKIVYNSLSNVKIVIPELILPNIPRRATIISLRPKPF